MISAGGNADSPSFTYYRALPDRQESLRNYERLPKCSLLDQIKMLTSAESNGVEALVSAIVRAEIVKN